MKYIEGNLKVKKLIIIKFNIKIRMKTKNQKLGSNWIPNDRSLINKRF